MLTSTERHIVEEIKKKIEKVATGKIIKVILYGSRATGGATKVSDFDILVVEKDLKSKRDEMHRLSEALMDLPYSIDVWVMVEEEFEETKSVIGGLAYPANKYGVMI